MFYKNFFVSCIKVFMFYKNFYRNFFLRGPKNVKKGGFLGGGRNYATNCDRMSLKFDFVPLQISVKFPIFDPFWGSRDCGCFYTTKGDRKCKSVGLCGKYYASRVTFATLDEVSWRFHQRAEIGNFIENRFFVCWKIRVFDPPGGPPPGRCTVCAAPRPRTPPSVPRFARVLAYLLLFQIS